METWLCVLLCLGLRIVVSLPMRDGNKKGKRKTPGGVSVVSLPMRDGNTVVVGGFGLQNVVVSLPMRDGNAAS